MALRCDLAPAQDRAALASRDGLGLGWDERQTEKAEILDYGGKARASVAGAHSSLKCRGCGGRM